MHATGLLRKGALLLVVMLSTACSLRETARMGTGLISHTLCTAAFVSQVDAERVYRDAVLRTSVMGAFAWGFSYEINRERQEVRATLLGGFEERAAAEAGGGCVSRPSAPGPIEGVRPGWPAREPLLPELAGAEPVQAADPALQRAVEAAFAPGPSGNGQRTKAVVVVRDGRVIAERYGEGYGVETRLPGYSISKSVVSALVGVLVQQGRLRADQPAPIAEWADPADPRHGITPDHLMRMVSGLQWKESLAGGPDDEARLWFLSVDKAALPIARPLAHAPGTSWQYNTGNTLVLSRIVRDQAGGSHEAALRFMHHELFDPLGMRSVAVEFDRTGTPMGGAGIAATARDWARFGLLYLNDGVAGSQRILPQGWVEYSAAPVPGAWVGYGAGFWTNRGDSQGATRRRGWGMPEGSFFASGHQGQIVLVDPQDRLVIARFGWSQGEFGGVDEISRQVGAIVAAARAAP